MRDVRHTLRVLRRVPGFTAIVVLTLALGIGANTALFSVVNEVLLEPLPYADPGHLVAIYENAPGFSKGAISYLNFLDWQRAARSFSSMAIYRYQDYNFTTSAQAERVSGMMVSAEMFRTLGVAPAAGRDFNPSDDRLGAAPVAILGGGFWRRRFGASPRVLGQSIILDGTAYAVIGVLPPGFTFYGRQRDVYTPIGQWADPALRDRRVEVSSYAIGRLTSGVTVAQGRDDLNAIARHLAQAYPVADQGIGITLLSLKQDLVGDVRPLLLMLLAAAGCLLLIACANVANLLLARALSRSREFAIRAALGASQGRVVRQVLTESLILAGAGGVCGLVLAVFATRAVAAALPETVRRANGAGIDTHVLLFTLGASVAAGVMFGFAPAWRSAHPNLQRILMESGRGASGRRHRTQRIFVVAEVALAVVLLVSAGLMLRSLQALWRVDPGFVPGHAITFDLSLPAAPNTTPAETRARLRRFDAAMEAIPGVEAVSVTLGARPMIHDTSLPFWIQGQAKPANVHEMPQVICYLVEAGFAPAMGITVKRGRFVTPHDDEHAPVVVDIDEDFARKYFPGQNPIGQHINIGGFDVQAEIVGVVNHVKQWRLSDDPASAVEAQMDYPFMQLPDKLMSLAAGGVAVVIRVKGDADAVMAAVRNAVHANDPGDVVYGVQTMEEVVASSFATRRLTMIILAVFAVLALALACIGIYGVASYLVGQRTREIGVRMALGAQRVQVMRQVLGEGLGMALTGAAVGAIAALGAAHLLRGELFGVGSQDPVVLGGVLVLLVLVTLVACGVPARRAMHVDAIVALRQE